MVSPRREFSSLLQYIALSSSLLFRHFGISVRHSGSHVTVINLLRELLLGVSQQFLRAVRLGYCSGRKAPVRNDVHRSSASQVGAFRGNDRMTIC